MGSTTQETLAWDWASWSISGGSSCQTRKQSRVREFCARAGGGRPLPPPGWAVAPVLGAVALILLKEQAPGGGRRRDTLPEHLGEGHLQAQPLSRISRDCSKDPCPTQVSCSKPQTRSHWAGKGYGAWKCQASGLSGRARELTPRQDHSSHPRPLERGHTTEKQRGLKHTQDRQRASQEEGKECHNGRGRGHQRLRALTVTSGRLTHKTAGGVKTLTPGLTDGSGR